MNQDRFEIPENAPKPGIYAHYKSGDEYEVTGMSLNSDTNLWHVEYKPLYTNPAADKFNRELSLWLEPAEKDGQSIERYKFVRLA
jgi:hypothetical protein